MASFNIQQQNSLLVKLMLPIARICIRCRIPIQSAYEALKIAFVEQASKKLEEVGEKQSLSRISIMSGLDRPSVRRIFQEQKFSIAETPIASKVIGQWRHDPIFTTKRGEPRELTFGMDDSEFANLVRLVTKNYSPGTILQDLIQQEIVEIKGNKVALVGEQIDYRLDDNRAINLYSRNADSLSQAFEENLEETSEDRNVHMRTEYDNIYVEQIPEIRGWLLNETAEFHKKIRDYLVSHDADLSPNKQMKAGGRVVLGSFSIAIGKERSTEQ